MTKFIDSIQKFTGNICNFQFVKVFPRHSVRFAKKYFKNRKVTVIEIGTAGGRHALQILKNLNVNKLYLIDPWTSYKGYETGENFNRTFEICKKRLRKYKNKVVYIRDFSDNAVNKVPNVDYIYIDGNHEYKFVKNDIENYYPKVKKKGILAGHDITNKKFNRDIVRAVMEFFIKKKIVPFISRTDWWIVKNN